jgi:hypothetical protein
MAYIDCECGTKVTLSAANTMVFTPSDKNFKGAWIEVICKCGETTTADLEQEQLEKFVGAGYAITIPFSDTPPLTQRHEAEIAKLGSVLEHMPDDVLAALFATPPPKSTLPTRWT